ncbi:MAG TPA: glycosyltransferase family 9 protein [Syntrophorhabdaceae bacterium]|nr:glycosyltransferase family 9 protein [Syntrophorhabdaceae bacterium]
MSIPAVKAIRDRFPDDHISWLVEGSVGEFLGGQDFVDEVIFFPRGEASQGLKTGNIVRTGKAVLPFLRRLREREYDLIIDFHGIAKSAIFSMIARGRKKIGFGNMYAKEKSHFFYHHRVNGQDKRMHKVERNMLLAHHLGCASGVPEVALSASDEATAFIDSFLKKTNAPSVLFAVNPFSSAGTDFKRWPMERYGQLITRLNRALGGKTVILWGPGEEEEARRLKALAGDAAVLACPTNIPQLFALLKKANAYIGGDTGVMHLAVAAGTPVAAIFGPTDVKVNAPYGARHLVITNNVPCSPCKNRDCKERECLTQISVDQVFESVMNLYNKSRAH